MWLYSTEHIEVSVHGSYSGIAVILINGVNCKQKMYHYVMSQISSCMVLIRRKHRLYLHLLLFKLLSLANV